MSEILKALEEMQKIKEEKKEKAKPKRERKTKPKTTRKQTKADAIYREPSERNLIIAIWDSEPSGVKLSVLSLIFGKHNSRKINMLIHELINRNILVRDRSGWIHINPYAIREILTHYDIQYSDDEIRLSTKDVFRRLLAQDRDRLKNSNPQW